MLFTASPCEFIIKTVPNAHIKGESFSTYADKEGYARVRANEGERITISAVGYSPAQIKAECKDVEVALEERPFKMSEIIVESAPLRMVEKTKTVEHIDERDMGFQTSPYMKPEEMFMFVPGVIYEGKDVAGSVPGVRGLARFRTVVYLQNMKVSTEREIGPSLFYAVPDVIDRGEIFKGGSTVFGSDAIGGSVLYFLKGTHSPNEIKLSYNSNNGLLGGYIGLKPISQVYIGFGGYNANNYYFPDTTKTDLISMIPANPSSFKKYSLNLSFKLKDFSVSGVSFLARDLYRAYKSSSINYYPEINENYIFLNFKNIEVGFHNYYTLSRKIKSSDTTDNRRFGNDLSVRFVYDFKNFALGLDYFGRYKVYSRVYENGNWSYDELEDASLNEFGGFILGNISRGLTEFSYGGRLGIFSASNVKNPKLSPALHFGVVQGIKDFYVRSNLILSYRFPSFLETNAYSPRPRGFLTGNPELKPENALTIEASLGYKSYLEITGFFIGVRNYIEMKKLDTLSSSGDTIYTYQNLPETGIITGVEFKGNLEYGFIRLRPGLTFMEGESGKEVLSDIPPPRIYLRFETLNFVSLYANLFYQAKTLEVAEIEEEREAFYTLDIGLSSKYKNFTFNIGVHNVTNQIGYRSLDPASLPQPGRSLFVHTRYTF